MNKISIFIHLLSWILVLSLPFIFPLPGEGPIINPALPKIDRDIFRLVESISTILLAAVFYFNYHVLIPLGLLQKKKILFLGGNLLLLILFLVYQTLSFHFLVLTGNSNNIFPPKGPSIPIFVVVVLISYGIRISAEWKRAEMQRNDLAKEKAAAEVVYLKSQLNPHFLFNTLNGIYALAVKKSEATPDAVMQLSHMMRYVLYESEAEKVSLEKELNYIKSYIDMQALRLSGNNTINYRVENLRNDVEILPLLLIPFIENAFKYGVSAEYETEISIIIRMDQKVFSFLCRNEKFGHGQYNEFAGIGIKNVKKRLNLVYPREHILEISETEKTFWIYLSIQL